MGTALAVARLGAPFLAHVMDVCIASGYGGPNIAGCGCSTCGVRIDQFHPPVTARSRIPECRCVEGLTRLEGFHEDLQRA